jgi:hypothetical protein
MRISHQLTTMMSDYGRQDVFLDRIEAGYSTTEPVVIVKGVAATSLKKEVVFQSLETYKPELMFLIEVRDKPIGDAPY